MTPSHCMYMSAVLTNFCGVLGRVVEVFCLVWLLGIFQRFCGTFGFFFVSRVFFFLESRSHCPKHHDSSKISLSMSHSMGSPPQSNGSYITEQLEGDTVDGARTQAEEQTASPYSKCPEEKKNQNKNQKSKPQNNPKKPTPYLSHLLMNKFSTTACFNSNHATVPCTISGYLLIMFQHTSNTVVKMQISGALLTVQSVF